MNFLIALWSPWTPVTLFTIAGIVSLGIGWDKSNTCPEECKTGRNLLIASNAFFAMGTALFAYGMHKSASGCNVSNNILLLSIFFYVIASVLIGVGSDRTDICTDTCKTGMNWLIASNVLLLLAGLIMAWHLGGKHVSQISSLMDISTGDTSALSVPPLVPGDWMTTTA